MQAAVRTYGVYAALTALIGYVLSGLIGSASGFGLWETLGYLTILFACSFVFFGIRRYRDHDLGGVITYGNAFRLGLLITLCAALAFALVDLIYVVWINPDFYQQYADYYLDNLRSELSAEEFEQEAAKMQEQLEVTSHPMVNFGVMFATVTLIGTLVSLISALILQRSQTVVSGS